MAGTRRSTRQTTTTAPKYNDDSSSSSEKVKSTRNTKKATHQKRTREEYADEDAEEKTSVPCTLAKDFIKDLHILAYLQRREAQSPNQRPNLSPNHPLKPSQRLQQHPTI
jgi:hypothetical protein